MLLVFFSYVEELTGIQTSAFRRSVENLQRNAISVCVHSKVWHLSTEFRKRSMWWNLIKIYANKKNTELFEFFLLMTGLFPKGLLYYKVVENPSCLDYAICEATFSTFKCIIISVENGRNYGWFTLTESECETTFITTRLLFQLFNFKKGGWQMFSFRYPSFSVSVNEPYMLRYHTSTHIEFEATNLGRIAFGFFPIIFRWFLLCHMWKVNKRTVRTSRP